MSYEHENFSKSKKELPSENESNALEVRKKIRKLVRKKTRPKSILK